MSIRFGLIGCGRMGEKHAATLAGISNARLVAVSDINPERMEAVEKRYLQDSGRNGKVAQYPDPLSLLNDSTIEAVVIATSTHLHAPLAQEAMRAGKHVMVEKPISLSLQEAEETINLAGELGRHLLVCHQLRYRPLLQKLKEWVEDERLGYIHLGSIRMSFARPLTYYLSSPWRGRRLTDGGMVVNQGIHLLDLLLWLMGEVDSIYGEFVHWRTEKETEDAALGILSFRRGGKGVMEMNVMTYPANLEMGLSLFGEKGTISLGGPSMNQIKRVVLEGHEGAEEEAAALLKEEGEERRMYEAFIRTLLSGERPS
ncbi:Oxidoreductase [[Clostridium] ultunense Esp]|nr:Oxidoreductase [[Clostridium] ultunense Esp]